MKRIVFGALFFLVVLVSACEDESECADCDSNPRIKLSFQATGSRTLADTMLDSLSSLIVTLTDSLTTTLTSEQEQTIRSTLTSLRADSAQFQENFDLFRVGKTNISFIDAPGAVSFEQFQDSIIRDFGIPVDMSQDTSTYYFNYHGLVDTLQVYYQREITQNLGGVRMSLTGIGVNEDITTFDSVLVKCYKAECRNDLTTIFVYF